MAVKPVVKPAVKTNKKVVAKKPAPKKVIDEEAVVEKKATAPKPKTKRAVVKKAPAKKSESLFDKLVEEFGLVPLAKCVKKSDGYKEALPNNPNREAFNKACNVSIEETDDGITLWAYSPAKKDWVVKKSANLENSLKRLLG